MAIKTYKRDQGDLRLTPNFKVREFACKCGKCSTTKIDEKLVNFVQKIRDHFGQPVTINSGYRCSAHNKKVGGASKSKHTEGMAADIVVKNVKPAEVAKFAESLGILGIGLYETDKDGYFVHVDTRTTKGFWYGQAQAKRTTFGGTPPKEEKKTNPKVKAFQEAAIKDGFKSVLKSGADGIWGSECEEVCKKATLYKTKFPWRLKNLTKFVQSELGIGADGKFGSGTHSAVIDYQEKCGFTGKDVDGIVGTKTYKKIMGVK
jgi:hypothetical protein